MAKISLITIGNELLKGRIVNTNATEIGSMLRQHGFALDRVLTVPDIPAAIQAAANAELALSDIVLMSGGLGPTKDDLTKHCLAELFGSKLVIHQPTMDFLEERYASRGRPLTETNKLQAHVPEVCEVIPNALGTAPGMLFQQGHKVLISMPGVPFELVHMVSHEVIPRLNNLFSKNYYTYRILRLGKLPESHAAEKMAEIEELLPSKIEVAYLPRHDGLWLELSLTERQAERAKAEHLLNKTFERVASHLAPWRYGEGEATIATLLGDALKHKGLTLAIAESLTGGMVASHVVDVSGSSAYFKGAVTAYDTAIKTSVLGVPSDLIQQDGVASEPVAASMAAKVRDLMKADIGIATTGLAEDDAGTGEKAHAWIGIADGDKHLAERVELFHSRNVNRTRAANYALMIALQQINLHEAS